MKKIIISIVLILITKIGFGQWQWAKQIGGVGEDGGAAFLDANNNIYCSGFFENNCFFDIDTLYSLGYNDFFLTKYDANNNELWIKKMGGNNPTGIMEYGGVVAIDNNNNYLYYAGSFYGSLTIDSYTATSSGGLDMFLAKFDLSGNCMWLKKAGSILDDFPGPLSLDANGNIFWTGVLANNGAFETNNLNKGSFLAKLDINGNILLARNEISGGYPSCIMIKNNEILMSGITESDTTNIDTMTLISNSQIDCFLAKTDLTGNIINAKRFGGGSNQFAVNFQTDTHDSIYLVGIFTDSMTIDSFVLSNNGKDDMFFTKLDSNFNASWVKQSHSTGVLGAKANSIVKDNEGKFYIVGNFSGNANFGTLSQTASSSRDFFLSRYDENGDCIGIRHFGEADAARMNIDNNGDIIVSGRFVNTVNIGTTSLTSHGNLDMFFAKSDAISGIGGDGRITNNQLIIYANPNKGTCNITVPDDFLHEKKLTLSIYDNTGKLIQQKTLEMNDGKIKLNLEAEAKGVYNVTLSNGKKSYNGKIVFE